MRRYVLVGLACIIAGSACNTRAPATDDAAPAPVDTPPGTVQAPDTSVATPPITQPAPQDTSAPTEAGEADARQTTGGGGQVSAVEYQGWRQYSVHCARCHGQDALPNPVAANLLVSLGRGGKIDTPEKFFQVVSEGRPARGMPAYEGILTPEQIQAIYAYLDGRAEDRIPPGRPSRGEG